MSTETVDPAAPFGRKPDGTPRKRRAWQDDPEKVKQAAETRARNRAERQQHGTLATRRTTPRSLLPRTDAPPALTIADADDMLSRHRREWDERMKELRPLVEEYERLEQALAVLNAV